MDTVLSVFNWCLIVGSVAEARIKFLAKLKTLYGALYDQNGKCTWTEIMKEFMKKSK